MSRRSATLASVKEAFDADPTKIMSPGNAGAVGDVEEEFVELASVASPAARSRRHEERGISSGRTASSDAYGDDIHYEIERHRNASSRGTSSRVYERTDDDDGGDSGREEDEKEKESVAVGGLIRMKTGGVGGDDNSDTSTDDDDDGHSDSDAGRRMVFGTDTNLVRTTSSAAGASSSSCASVSSYDAYRSEVENANGYYDGDDGNATPENQKTPPSPPTEAWQALERDDECTFRAAHPLATVAGEKEVQTKPRHGRRKKSTATKTAGAAAATADTKRRRSRKKSEATEVKKKNSTAVCDDSHNHNADNEDEERISPSPPPPATKRGIRRGPYKTRGPPKPPPLTKIKKKPSQSARLVHKFVRCKHLGIRDAKEKVEGAKLEKTIADEEVERLRLEMEDVKRRYDAAIRRRDEAAGAVVEAEEEVKKLDLEVPLIWNKMYRRLVEHLETNPSGDAILRKGPTPSERKSHPHLAELQTWILRQRVNRTKMEKSFPLRYEALEKLGFVWDVKADLLRRRAKEMEEYIAEHGHLDVPIKFPQNQSFAYWVHERRRMYRDYKRGLPSSMTPAKILELDSIGFIWAPTNGRKRKRPMDDMSEEEQWNEKYDMLVEHHRKHGHCLIQLRAQRREAATPPPRIYALATWASWQRKQYVLLNAGEPSQLTQERIDKLNSLGFLWEHHGNNKPSTMMAVDDEQEEKGEDDNHDHITEEEEEVEDAKREATWVDEAEDQVLEEREEEEDTVITNSFS